MHPRNGSCPCTFSPRCHVWRWLQMSSPTTSLSRFVIFIFGDYTTRFYRDLISHYQDPINQPVVWKVTIKGLERCQGSITLAFCWMFPWRGTITCNPFWVGIKFDANVLSFWGISLSALLEGMQYRLLMIQMTKLGWGCQQKTGSPGLNNRFMLWRETAFWPSRNHPKSRCCFLTCLVNVLTANMEEWFNLMSNHQLAINCVGAFVVTLLPVHMPCCSRQDEFWLVGFGTIILLNPDDVLLRFILTATLGMPGGN